MHSPFVFKFITEILEDRHHSSAYDSVAALVQRLKHSNVQIFINDRGAGSAVMNDSKRSISDIVKNTGVPKKYGRLLFRISKYFKPESIVEIGTGTGISTAYLSLGNGGAQIISIEGSGEIFKVAQENIAALELSNVSLVHESFDEALPNVISKIKAVDLAFIDGNHRKAPTIKYFGMLKKAARNDSVFIFDDIHWSEEMELAWQEIINDESVRLSFDLFRFGIVFFRKEQKVKQHFVLKF